MTEPHVFISYSSKDLEAALTVVTELEMRGLTCWIANRDIQPGAAYDERVISALLACQVLVVLVSSDSIASRHVRAEVARASSEGKLIFPVRLIDVEVAGGLQFHLELSQWVDFFPSPTAESYDKLADAIKLGELRGSSAIRMRPNPKRWALLTVGGVAAVILTTFLGLFGYSEYWQHRAATEYEHMLRDQEEQRTRMEQERNAAEFARIELHPGFRILGDGVYLTQVSTNFQPGDASEFMVGFQINEGQLQIFPRDRNPDPFQIEIAELELIVFHILDSDGNILRSFDKTDELRSTVENELRRLSESLVGSTGNLRSVCTISGCSFGHGTSRVCLNGVTNVLIESNGERFEIPRHSCQLERSSATNCIAAQDLPFPLVPGAPLMIVYKLIDGTETHVEGAIRTTEHRYSDLPVAQIANATSSDAESSAPSLFANYTAPTNVEGGFRFFFGWGTCPDNGELNLSSRASQGVIFLDVDGLGFSAIRNESSALAPFSPGQAVGRRHALSGLALPAGPQNIRLAFGDETGIKHGPWVYHFDPAHIVRQTTAGNQIPEVTCRRVGFWEPEGCHARHNYTFFEVGAVEFGFEPGLFLHIEQIDYDAEAYLAGEAPFSFQVPDDWTNVYTRVILRDGSSLAETRHDL